MWLGVDSSKEVPVSGWWGTGRAEGWWRGPAGVWAAAASRCRNGQSTGGWVHRRGCPVGKDGQGPGERGGRGERGIHDTRLGAGIRAGLVGETGGRQIRAQRWTGVVVVLQAGTETGMLRLTCAYRCRVLGGSRGGGWRQPIGLAGRQGAADPSPRAGCRRQGMSDRRADVGRKAQLKPHILPCAASCPTRGDPRGVRPPPPASGPPSSRYGLGTTIPGRPRALTATTAHRPGSQGLLGVEVFNASPGCSEDAFFFKCLWGG